jgi:DNA-binding Lrp family transcriptional regulator
VIRKYTAQVRNPRLGLKEINLTFHKLDLKKTQEIGAKKIMEMLGSVPNFLRVHSLIPTTDYNLVTYEVYKDANDYQRFITSLHNEHPEWASLVRRRLVFPVNFEDPVLNKANDLSNVIEVVARYKGIDLSSPPRRNRRRNTALEVATTAPG